MTLSIPDSVVPNRAPSLPPNRPPASGGSRPSPVLAASPPAGVAPGVDVNGVRQSRPSERTNGTGKGATSKGLRDDSGLPLLPPTPFEADGRSSKAWAPESFDDRLACPKSLSSAVESLLSEHRGGELDALVERSAFVVPGREGMARLALAALREGRHAFFLVAILPVLEHGLRCLFSCANDSPGHLFAHLRQYYSTLDGVRISLVRNVFRKREIRPEEAENTKNKRTQNGSCMWTKVCPLPRPPPPLAPGGALRLRCFIAVVKGIV